MTTITEKPCTGCEEIKPVTEFGIRKSSKDGYQWKCKSCRLEEKYANRKRHRDEGTPYDSILHVQKNPEQHKKNMKKHRAKVRNFARELKLDIPCADCNQIFPPMCMDWDHLPGAEKKFNISEAGRFRMGKDKILAEIAKCELVCSNCHRIRTAKRNNDPWFTEQE